MLLLTMSVCTRWQHTAQNGNLPPQRREGQHGQQRLLWLLQDLDVDDGEDFQQEVTKLQAQVSAFM